MGLDLDLHVDEYRVRFGAASGRATDLPPTYNPLSLARDCRVFDAIEALKPRPCESGQRIVYHDDEAGLKHVTEDHYGHPLTCLTAGELAGIALPSDSGAWQRAVWAFLRELPADTVVVLDWK